MALDWTQGLNPMGQSVSGNRLVQKSQSPGSPLRWPGRTPNIVALHGFTGTALDFSPLGNYLPYALEAPNLPGHGAATWPQNGFETYDNIVDEYAQALKQPTVLLGYSLGGRLALSIALRVPAKVMGLILIGASPGLNNPVERAHRAEQDRRLAHRIRHIGTLEFLAEWQQHPLIATQQNIAPNIRVAMDEGRQSHTANGLALSLEKMGTGAMPPLWNTLSTLECPTLALYGESDIKYRDIAQSMAQRNELIEVQGVPTAGHCAHLENPEFTMQAIAEFTTRHWA